MVNHAPLDDPCGFLRVLFRDMSDDFVVDRQDHRNPCLMNLQDSILQQIGRGALHQLVRELVRLLVYGPALVSAVTTLPRGLDVPLIFELGPDAVLEDADLRVRLMVAVYHLLGPRARDPEEGPRRRLTPC